MPSLSHPLPALVEALPAQPGAPSEESLLSAHPGAEPVPTSADGRMFTRERQVAFLHALAATGAVRAAAARGGVSHQTAYRERLASAPFRRAWDAALLAARCHAEEVLSCRAIDGVEEEVWYHGEIVATRRRFDSRLLLAHLARLDRLTAGNKVKAFAGDFEAALARFAEGSDAPETPPPAPGEKKSPGQRSKWSMLDDDADDGAEDDERAFADCPECGGACLGPEDDLWEDDCRWMGNRLKRMDAARPAGAKQPHEFAGHDPSAVDDAQLAAFEAGAERWWLVVAPGPGDDPDDWHYDE